MRKMKQEDTPLIKEKAKAWDWVSMKNFHFYMQFNDKVLLLYNLSVTSDSL